MKTLAVALVLSLAVPAAAQDAPLLTPVVPAVGGTLTPQKVLCLDESEQLALAKRLEADKARIATYAAAPAPLHPAIVVGLVVLGVVAGGAAGYGLAVATRPAP